MYPFLNWSSTNVCTSSLSSLDSEYTFPSLGINPSFNSMVWSQIFRTGILSDSFFPNTFFHFQNLLGTSLFDTSSSSSLSVSLTFFSFTSCFLLPHIGGQRVIFTSPFSQSISGLWAASHGIPSINSVFPKLHTSILALSICPLKNILHSTWCIIALPHICRSIYISNLEGFFQLFHFKPLFLCKGCVHKQTCRPTIQQRLHCYSFMTFQLL